MIIPFIQEEKRIGTIEGAIRALKKQRKGVTLGKRFSIKKMRAQGWK